MKSSPIRRLLLGGAGLLTLGAAAAFAQSRGPESLLPPGFGDPADQPQPKDEPAPQPSDVPEPLPPPSPVPPPARGTDVDVTDAAEADLEEVELPRPTNYFAIPPGAARPTDQVGVLEPGNFGFAADSFGDSSGPFLATLMRRLDAPVASRWTSILLRRALLSRLDAPRGIEPVDWVAERAFLLLRMGEADAARMLVQSIDRPDYTPRMVEVAGQVALATADPAALCPLVELGRRDADDAIWPLSEAICAALEGEPARAGALIDQARRRWGGNIDLLLAEKVIGAGAQSRRAVTIEWEEVDSLTPWRFGLAAATGMEIPARLIGDAPAHIRAWYARAPMVPLEQRVDAAAFAATLGVFSSQSLIDIHSLLLDQTDPADVAGTIAARLRTAWSHGEADERLEALRGLWGEAESPRQRYARSILTAGAAARVPASEDFGESADELVAAMLSAGRDREAETWAEAVAGGAGGEAAWALLALGGPGPAVEVSASRVESFASADESPGRRRTQLLIAGLAGLGRIDANAAGRLAADYGVDLGAEGSWARAIDAAARARQPATVALLAGVGMQTLEWGRVPPRHVFRIVRALAAVGHEYEARMIAAEALARL